MTGDDFLCECVSALLNTASELLPAQGLGIVRKQDAEHVVFTYQDAFGVTAYRVRVTNLPESFRPRATGLVQLTTADLEINPAGLVESRLFHTEFAGEFRHEFGAHRICTLPIAEHDESALLVVGLGESSPLTAAQISGIHQLAVSAVKVLQRGESPDEEMERLRRLAAADKLLPALFRVLDVREIFDRLSMITKEVLRHDFASIGIFSEDLTRVDLYAETSDGPYARFRQEGGPMPFPRAQTETWLYRIIHDLTTHAFERNAASVKSGGRTSIRVAIRLEDKILGALNFTSRDAVPGGRPGHRAADCRVRRARIVAPAPRGAGAIQRGAASTS